MTGYENYNFPAFHRAAEALREMGHEVWSPAEMDEAEGVEPSPTGQLPDPKQYAQFLARDIQVIADNEIEGIVVLPGWQNSGGAKTEVAFARALKLPVFALFHDALWEIPAYGSSECQWDIDESPYNTTVAKGV